MNEPPPGNTECPPRFQAPVIAAAARRGAPDHTLIVGGNRWNVAEAFFQGADTRTPGLSKPLADPSIVYSFHFYSPMEFTHQALANAGERYGNLKGVP